MKLIIKPKTVLSWGIALLAVATIGCKNDSKNTQTEAVAGVSKTKQKANAASAQPVDSPVKSDRSELKVETDTYRVYCDAPKEIVVGEEAEVSFYIEPAEGWKMNKEFPSKIKIEPRDGLDATQQRDFMIVDSAASFPSALKATKAFEAEVEFELRFAVCTDATCDPKMEKIKVPMMAKVAKQ